MSRISRHTMFMDIAHVVSRRSTCFRRSIGAVLVYKNNIYSIGYNGPAAGEPHCIGLGCMPDGQLGCKRALHAEANAIDRCPSPIGCTMYTTESPCLMCAELIIDSKISAMYYTHLYRVTEGADRVAQLIPVFRVTPSGYVVDHITGEIVNEDQGQGIAGTCQAP
jgi:dCMP deaminase